MKNIKRGNRLKHCRMMLQKTLMELGAAHQVSIGTLSNWESGTSPITEKNIYKILSLLAAEGLICTREWLLEGQGEEPYIYNPSHQQKNKTDESFDLTGQFLFFKEIEAFKKAHSDMLITIMRDDAMLPFLRVGDYVGGLVLPKAEYTKAQSNICIIEVEEGEFLIRQFFMQDKILLLSFALGAENNFILLEKEPLNVAPLSFMRRF